MPAFHGLAVMAHSETGSGGTLLVDVPPTAGQSWSAIAVAAALLIGFAAVAPFAGMPLAQLNAFFPSLDAVVFVTDLVTSVLLFAQFWIFHARALLALAIGYLFTALIVVPHALTFSGAFSPGGLLGAGPQTGSWLFIFWHVGFAMALLAYAVFRDEKPAKSLSDASTLPAIGWSVAGVVGLVCGLAWLATGGVALLPPLIVDNTFIGPWASFLVAFTILICVIALALLSYRRRSVLDQWLMVVTLALMLELAFSGLLPSVRFSLGFYAGRMFSLVTSSIVLIVLLAETTRLYVRLARSNAMLQRERRNKLMNLEAMAGFISHEIKQPLAAMLANTEAAVALIKREPPDLAVALSALDDVNSDVHRTTQVLQGIRALFDKTKGESEIVDVNETALVALRILRGELNDHGITARADLAAKPPHVLGQRSQLQEVMINLVHNAIEAMASVNAERRVLTVRTVLDGGKAVVVEVEDTGPGIDPENIDKVFDAFVTTKPGGMGLGLAICQMIVERHGGQLSASPAHPSGTIFRVVLPQRSSPH